MTPWMRYLIAFLVLCHGFVYVRIGPTLPGRITGWKGTSMLLGRAVTGDTLIALVRPAARPQRRVFQRPPPRGCDTHERPRTDTGSNDSIVTLSTETDQVQRHLLYVQVGSRQSYRFAFSPEQTSLVQRLFVERAFRWVFARRPIPWLTEAHPRIVDADQFARERRAWRGWHESQMKGERGSARCPSRRTARWEHTALRITDGG